MQNLDATRTSQRANIADLSPIGTELADEHLQLAAGGQLAAAQAAGAGLMCVCASYQAASSTLCNDTDYHRVD